MHHFQHIADWYYYACGDAEKAALYDTASSILWLFAQGIAESGASLGIDPIARRINRTHEPFDVLHKQLDMLAHELRRKQQ
jgi:hypothetical protein